MNQTGRFMISAALLLGTAVASALPVASVRTAEAADAVNVATAPEANPLASQFFRVEWSAAPGTRGRARLTGRVYNSYGEAAENVQLRINSLDASGKVVSTVTRPVMETVPAEANAYFDVQVPNGGSYQVAVDTFDFLEEPGK